MIRYATTLLTLVAISCGNADPVPPQMPDTPRVKTIWFEYRGVRSQLPTFFDPTDQSYCICAEGLDSRFYCVTTQIDGVPLGIPPKSEFPAYPPCARIML